MKHLTLSFLLAIFCASACFAQSSDLRAFGVKGKIKRIATSEGEGVAFDKNGKVFSIRIGSDYGKSIKHSNGRLSYVNYPSLEEGQMPTTQQYSYANGVLSSVITEGHEFEERLYYSNYKNGLPTTVKILYVGEPFIEEGTCKITYTQYDSHGNWTRCVWSGTLRCSDDGGYSYYNRKQNDIITRQIFYY